MPGGIQWSVRPSPHHNRLTEKSRADRFPDYLATTASDADGPKTFTAFVKPSLGALRKAIRRTSRLADKNLGVEITSLPLINPPITKNKRARQPRRASMC